MSLALQSRLPEEQINGDIDIASTSAARAIYLAGFTYLRLRLYASTPASDVRFLSFIAASFCLSVLSASLSLIFKFFLDRCETLQQKIQFDQNSRLYYVKGAYICFLLALISFCVGLSRIGWVYFAEMDSKWISFALFISSAVAIISTTIYIGQTKRNVDSKDDKTSLTLPPQRSGETIDVFLSKQMDVLIERSIFIGGIAINGVTFYVEVESYQNQGRGYLFFMSISAVSTLFVSGMLSTLRIAMQDIPSGPAKIRYAYTLLPLGQACFVIYIAAILFLVVGLMVIGYGVHYDRDKSLTLAINAIGAAGLLGTIFYSSYCYTNSLTIPSSSKEKSDLTPEDHVKSTLTSSKLMGTICNITSGFVFFNLLFYSGVLNNEHEGTAHQSQLYLISNALALILCILVSVFDSILQLFTNDLETFAHRSLYLEKMGPVISFTQVGTFMAMICVFISYGLGAVVKFRPNSYIPAISSGVGGVMILVGVLVFAIQRKKLPEYMSRLDEGDKSIQDTSNSLQRDNSVSSSSSSSTPQRTSIPKHKAERYAKRPTILSTLTGCVMFFGGFAYTAIINLSYDDKPVENRFVLLMSLIFVFSYSVVVWGIFYLLFFSSCATPKEKILYVIVTSPVYKAVLVISGLALVATIVGFCLMGYTKTYAENYHAFSATMIGAASFSSFLVLVILGRVYLDYKSVTNATKSQYLEDSLHATATGSDISKPSSSSSASPPADCSKVLLNQLSATVGAASFIAGNILYELLFVNPLYRYNEAITIAYIIFAALTFTSAVSAVVITNITIFLIGTLTQQEGNIFSKELINHGIQLFVFSFTLSALLTWMTAAGLLPHAVYLQTKANRWPLTIFCVVTIVVIIYSLFKAYALILEVSKRGLKGGEIAKETESNVISDL